MGSGCSSLLSRKHLVSITSSSTSSFMSRPVRLRVVWCDVDEPRFDALPIELELAPSTTVLELQTLLAARRPGQEPSPERVRLFAPAVAGCWRPLGALEPTLHLQLVFCSRPARTLDEMRLCSDSADLFGESAATSPGRTTIYWVSNLMKFQGQELKFVPLCDPQIAARAKEIVAASAMRADEERLAAAEAFWARKSVPWPFADGFRRFYASEETHYGEGCMGSSVSLQLLPTSGEFRLHAHSWSDNGNSTSHRHALTKGRFVLVPPAAGGRRADPEPRFELQLMPTHGWGSHRPPVEWDDDKAFIAKPRATTPPLPSGHIDAHGVSLDGKVLAPQAQA